MYTKVKAKPCNLDVNVWKIEFYQTRFIGKFIRIVGFRVSHIYINIVGLPYCINATKGGWPARAPEDLEPHEVSRIFNFDTILREAQSCTGWIELNNMRFKGITDRELDKQQVSSLCFCLSTLTLPSNAMKRYFFSCLGRSSTIFSLVLAGRAS